MKMAFGPAGDVREVDLLAAFVVLWREARSGSLLFSRGAMASAGFQISDGEIVAVTSSEPRFETAAILVRAGKLEGSALERLSVPPGSDAALAALAAGILTRREWKWGEKIRAIEILADVLSWPDGRYAFDEGARPARGEFVLTVPRLLLELFLRSRDRNLIEHQLGPVDLPLVRSAAFDEEFATFGLTADAESVVRLIDGAASASEISERAPAEEFAVLKLLAALKTLGLLQTEDAVAEELEAPAPPRFELPDEGAAQGAEAEPWTRAIPSIPVDEEIISSAEEPSDLPLGASVPSGEEPFSPSVDQEPSWPDAEAEAPRLDAPLEETPDAGAAASWESPTADVWDAGPSEPLDRPLAGDAEELPEQTGSASRSLSPYVVGGILLVLLAAVAGMLLWRSASVTRVAGPQEVPTRLAPSPTAVSVAAPPLQAALPTPVPTAPPVRPSPAASPRSRKSPPSPSPPPVREAVSAVPGEDRSAWLDRARKDAKRLEAEKKTRYAIQLELVCETGSLVQAWKHDRPAGSMWVMTTPHGDRQCFRVFWGRYGSIGEARRAKAGIPAYFVTSTNRPSVVAVH